MYNKGEGYLHLSPLEADSLDRHKSSIVPWVGLSEDGKNINENISFKEGMEESRVNGISVTISTYPVIEILSLRDFSLLFKSHLKIDGNML